MKSPPRSPTVASRKEKTAKTEHTQLSHDSQRN